MTVSPHLFFCAGDRCAPGKQLGNVRTSLEELSQVKIEMDFEVSLRPVAGIAGHTSIAFEGIPTDWIDTSAWITACGLHTFAE